MSVYRSTGRVTFSETDASGRYHYTHAFRWAEDAEHELYRAAGLAVASFPRGRVSATFQRPLADGDEYVVELAVDRVGTSSITYAWRILTAGSGSGAVEGEGAVEVAVEGAHTVVHLGADGRPAPVPDGLRSVLAGLTADAC